MFTKILFTKKNKLDIIETLINCQPLNLERLKMSAPLISKRKERKVSVVSVSTKALKAKLETEKKKKFLTAIKKELARRGVVA